KGLNGPQKLAPPNSTGAERRANRSTTPIIPFIIALAVGFALPAQAADEMSAEIIAVQIREQGYACDKALSAEREHPELDDAVWIIKCDNARYRVRLIPDMAAKVEKLN